MSIKVLKKADQKPIPVESFSAFQIGQAKVKSQHALKTLEFYGEYMSDPEFQKFLRRRVSEICTMFPLPPVIEKV
jgi:hypothetical protein